MKNIILLALFSLLASCSEHSTLVGDFNEISENVQCTQLDYDTLTEALDSHVGAESNSPELYDALARLDRRIYDNCRALIFDKFNECMPGLASTSEGLITSDAEYEYLNGPLSLLGVEASKEIVDGKVKIKLNDSLVSKTCLNGQFPPRLVFSNTAEEFSSSNLNNVFFDRTLNSQSIAINILYVNDTTWRPTQLFLASESSPSIHNINVDNSGLAAGAQLSANTCGTSLLLTDRTCSLSLTLDGSVKPALITESELVITHDFVAAFPYFSTLLKVKTKQVDCFDDSHCSSHKHCSSLNCNLDQGRCDTSSDCADYEYCDGRRTCELYSGRCRTNSNCRYDEVCNSNHYCIDDE